VVALDYLEHILGKWTPGMVGGGGADGEGEIQVVAQTVGEEEFGGGEGDVVLADVQNGLRVMLGAEEHIVLQVDAALRKAGAAGAIEPEGAIVLRGLRRLQRRRGRVAPAREIVQRHLEAPALQC
jgi:hypothetical protein